jgi:glyoxylase-like metal-dependent hydrolase (beta-lactamase superfamily II)
MTGFAETKMQLGRFTLRSVVADRFRLAAEAGPRAHVDVVCRLLLVDGPAGRTLIDAGPVDGAELIRVLEDAGIGAGSIDRLVLTHLHSDHAGGAPLEGKPTHIQEANLAAARAAVGGDRSGYRSADLERIGRAGVVPISGDAEILPGLRVTVSNGHAPGMQIVWIEDANEALVHAADLIPTLSHLRLPGSGEYDVDPEVLQREKTKLIEETLRRRAWLFLYHDTRHVAVRLGGTPERPVAVEEVTF